MSTAAELQIGQSARVVEITGDCPLVDPGIVDAAVERYARGGADYVANVLDVLTFPIGFDVQAGLFHRAIQAEARIIDQHIHPAVFPLDPLHRGLNLIVLGYVHFQSNGAKGHQIGHLLKATSGGVDDHSFGKERLGKRLAHAR